MTGPNIALLLGTSDGGVGAHVRVLARRLVESGAAVVVYGPVATEERFDFTGTGAGFAAVRVSQGPRPLADRAAVAAFRASAIGADLVHAHGLRAGFIAVRAAPAGVPVVVTWHNAVLATGLARRIYAVIEKRIATGAALNLAVSSDLVARIRELGGIAELAPVGSTRRTPTRSVQSVRSELAAGERPIVLSVGRLHPQKGLDTLVDAAVALKSRRPVPLFVVAGEGPQRADLERRIAAGAAPVQLLGRRDDVPDLLAAADVVAMPSRWEGSPLAAHEALLAARPLVAAAVGGIPDLASDGAIKLVPPGDPHALASAIALLLEDPVAARELAARGLRRAQDWPDSEASADAAIERYASLLGS